MFMFLHIPSPLRLLLNAFRYWELRFLMLTSYHLLIIVFETVINMQSYCCEPIIMQYIKLKVTNWYGQ